MKQLYKLQLELAVAQGQWLRMDETRNLIVSLKVEKACLQAEVDEYYIGVSEHKAEQMIAKVENVHSMQTNTSNKHPKAYKESCFRVDKFTVCGGLILLTLPWSLLVCLGLLSYAFLFRSFTSLTIFVVRSSCTGPSVISLNCF